MTQYACSVMQEQYVSAHKRVTICILCNNRWLTKTILVTYVEIPLCLIVQLLCLYNRYRVRIPKRKQLCLGQRVLMGEGRVQFWSSKRWLSQQGRKDPIMQAWTHTDMLLETRAETVTCDSSLRLGYIMHSHPPGGNNSAVACTYKWTLLGWMERRGGHQSRSGPACSWCQPGNREGTQRR